ncbi:hypothetical protein PS645_01315 [Pseudomonas fluorescens]|uniref:GST N-terminal domain-containing protein n=1 Tax=Pseudomonas fluorescens TaxID=294 RepID=A0A5E6R9Y0_PSEFL|nr:hypothetical protein PS645_01315 [Pseudomonas fluorescens]
MIDLYTAAPPNGHKVSIVLKEPGMPCTGYALSIYNMEYRHFKTVQPEWPIPNRIDDARVFNAQASLIR